MKTVRNEWQGWGEHYVMYRMDRCRNGRCYSHGLLVAKWEREEARDVVARKLRRTRAKLLAHMANVEAKLLARCPPR